MGLYDTLYTTASDGGQYDKYGNMLDPRGAGLANLYASSPAGNMISSPDAAYQAPKPVPAMAWGQEQMSNPIYDFNYTGALPGVDPNSKATPLGLGGVNTAFQQQRGRDSLSSMWDNNQKQFYSGLAPNPVLQSMANYRNGSGGEFGMNHGVDAFLGGYTNGEFGGGYTVNPGMDQQTVNEGAGGINALRQLGLQTGFQDVGKYADTDMGKRALYDDLNSYLKDYWGVSGKDPQASYGDKAATRALYKDDGTGNLQAVSNPRVYGKAPKDNGFIGKESLTALSLALPMFGGWAGMLGQGAAGTLSAGQGLGLTSSLGSTIGTGAANALVNAGMGTLMNGGGGQGFLQSLLTQGLGAGVNSAMGGSGLSNMFNTANPGASTFNPMQAFQQGLGRIGLAGSPVGLASRYGPQALSGLSRLFSS